MVDEVALSDIEERMENMDLESIAAFDPDESGSGVEDTTAMFHTKI